MNHFYLPLLISLSSLFFAIDGAKAQQIPAEDSLVRDSSIIISKKARLPKAGLALNTISGLLADSVSKKPLDYITIGLKTTAGVSLKSTLSKADGSFTLEKVSAGSYILSIVAVGYLKKTLSVVLDSSKIATNLGTILLSLESKQLAEVTITGDKPLIRQEVDRIAYDVQADPESKIDNVLDMMRKVPLLTVDGENKIKLKGNDNFRILIDGRPSSLVAKNPEDVFRSMPATNIIKIEVITTPPAKYDSEGLAGIINIITNKKLPGGYNGSLGARYNFLSGPSANGSLTSKHKKIGLSLNGSRNWHTGPEAGFNNSRLGLIPVSQYDQLGSRSFKGNFGYLGAETSYEIDTLNLITASFGYNRNSGTELSGSLNQFYGQDGLISQSYRLNNDVDYQWGGFDLGVNYELGFKRNKEQLLTTSYKYVSNTDETLTEILTSEKINYTSPGDYRQKNNVDITEQTIQLDYVYPFKKLTIEAGSKAIFRHSSSDYTSQNFDAANGSVIADADIRNTFRFQQNIYSFYNSYQIKSDPWVVKAGLRLEQTVIDADFASSGTFLKTNRNNLIPSVSVQRKLEKTSSLTLGYTQRIQRPNIWRLNPFQDKNDKFVYSGNPELKPVLYHNFDLTYSTTKKGSFTPGLYYFFANNTVQHMTELDGDTTRTTFKNVGKNQTVGLNLNFNYPFNQKLSLTLNSRLAYQFLEGQVSGKELRNEGVQGNASGNASYKFRNDWRASVNGGYNSPWIGLQGQSNAYFYSSASLSKEFMKKKANFSASVSNPFQKYRSWKNETATAEFIQRRDYNNFYRQINLSVNYKFGKLSGGIKKNKRGIQNDDFSGGKN